MPSVVITRTLPAAIPTQAQTLLAGQKCLVAGESGVAIAILAGLGELSVYAECLALVPLSIIWLPAQTLSILSAQTTLTYLQMADQTDSPALETPWLIKL